MRDRFLKACRKEEVDATPVWLMRQAGRYLSEYRKIRKKTDFLTMCKTPDLAAEITLQPVERFEVDAAILFSDILIPVEAMGARVEFKEKEGPKILEPAKNKEAINSLEVLKEEKVAFVEETIKILKRELEKKVPLIGFSGAPFTLASYLVEGGHSKNYLTIKKLMYNEPSLYHALMKKIEKTVIRYLKLQIKAGVDALQLFDSWAGALSSKDYEEFVLPYTKRIVESAKGRVPLIYFSTATSGILELTKETGADIIGVDWRVDIGVAWKRLGYDVGIQGNLDPATLFAPPKLIEKRVREILDKTKGKRGYIFNLGHGVLPETPPENVAFVVNLVHEYSQKTKTARSRQRRS